MPALVSALKSVDLPTLGNPTMPHLRLMVMLRGSGACGRVTGPSRVCSAIIARSMSPAAIAGHDASARASASSMAAALVGTRRLQHVVDHVLLRKLGVARMPDADAQPPEVGDCRVARGCRAGRCGPAWPPPNFIFASPGLEVELVVHDEDLFRRDGEEARERRHRHGRRGSCRSRASRCAPRRTSRRRPANFDSAEKVEREASRRARRRTRTPRCGACSRSRDPDCRDRRRGGWVWAWRQ